MSAAACSRSQILPPPWTPAFPLPLHGRCAAFSGSQPEPSSRLSAEERTAVAAQAAVNARGALASHVGDAASRKPHEQMSIIWERLLFWVSGRGAREQVRVQSFDSHAARSAGLWTEDKAAV